MLTRFVVPLFGFAIFSSASSFPVVVQVNPVVEDWCAGLGGNTIENLGTFTLSAWNPTGNNPNATGLPLVLSIVNSMSGASTHAWATWDSFPYNDWPSLTMNDGAIEANGPIRSVTISAASGSPVVFLTKNTPSQEAPAQIFCAVPTNDVSGKHPHPYLAVHGHYDKWFLCAKVYRPDLITWRVVYDVTAGVPSRDYSVETCYRVLLNIVA